jgi:hypothetical protein
VRILYFAMKIFRKHFTKVLSYYLLFIFVTSIFFCFDAECIQGRFDIEDCTSIVNYLIYQNEIDLNTADNTNTENFQGTDIDGKWCCSIQVIPSIDNPIVNILFPNITLIGEYSVNVVAMDMPSLLQPPRA